MAPPRQAGRRITEGREKNKGMKLSAGQNKKRPPQKLEATAKLHLGTGQKPGFKYDRPPKTGCSKTAGLLPRKTRKLPVTSTQDIYQISFYLIHSRAESIVKAAAGLCQWDGLSKNRNFGKAAPDSSAA
jgi:hypothetical protein